MPLRRTIGGFITNNPTEPTAPYALSSGDGVWSLTQQFQDTGVDTWPTAGRPTLEYLAVCNSSGGSVYADIYPWSNGTTGRYGDPINPLNFGNQIRGFAFHPTGRSVVAIANGSPPVAYRFSRSGYGTKFASPAGFPTNLNAGGISFSPDGNYVAVCHSSGVRIYQWSDDTGFGSQTAYFGGSNVSVAFSNNGSYIAVGSTSSPYLSVYPYSAGVVGSKYADPATLPPSTVSAITFSPTDDAILIATALTPFIMAYPWSSSGFGIKYPDPASLPAGAMSDIDFTRSGALVFCSGSSTGNGYHGYEWSSSGFGTRRFTGSGTTTGIRFSRITNIVARGGPTTSSITVNAWDDTSGFGTNFTIPNFRTNTSSVIRFGVDG